jgi:DNA-binding NarL/FixJ family response regulator
MSEVWGALCCAVKRMATKRMNTETRSMTDLPPAAPRSTRLLIVDDHPVFRRGISQFLSTQEGLTVCAEAENAQSALEAMRRHKPDLALLDVSMPGTDGIELTKLMLAEQPDLLILMFSMHEDSSHALRALRAGARGYVMKQNAMESVLEAARKVMGGGIYVSPQFAQKLGLDVNDGMADIIAKDLTVAKG